MQTGFIVDRSRVEQNEREARERRNAVTVLYLKEDIDFRESFRRRHDNTFHDYQKEEFKNRYSEFEEVAFMHIWLLAEDYISVRVISMPEDHPVNARMLHEMFPNLEKIEVRMGEVTTPQVVIEEVSAEDFRNFFSERYVIGTNASENDFPDAHRAGIFKTVPYDQRRYPDIIPIYEMSDFAGGGCFVNMNDFDGMPRTRTYPKYGKIQVGTEILRPARHYFEKQ